MPAQAYEPFVIFGRSHLIVLALSLAVPVVLAVVVRLAASRTLERVLCWTLALVIGGVWIVWYFVFHRMGWLNIGNALPLDLCSWAAIATIATLVAPNQRSYELAYFWAIAGTTQGLVTPDIPFDFPEFRFIEFSTFHGGIIVAVIFLTLGLKWRPTAASIPRVMGWSLVYMAIAGVADWALQVNYGFLRAKPGHASLYDLMPVWPWYLGVVVVLALISVLICYSPFAVVDLVKYFRKKPA
jgi:hypothetical integral membrane protein (TIGR02206 family)